MVRCVAVEGSFRVFVTETLGYLGMNEELERATATKGGGERNEP
jgi:hypothetical protein